MSQQQYSGHFRTSCTKAYTEDAITLRPLCKRKVFCAQRLRGVISRIRTTSLTVSWPTSAQLLFLHWKTIYITDFCIGCNAFQQSILYWLVAKQGSNSGQRIFYNCNFIMVWRKLSKHILSQCTELAYIYTGDT